jgi:L-rhamnose mutarotase
MIRPQFASSLNNKGNTMQRVCFTLRVKPERLAEYKKAHENVWPEMRAALTKHGWHNYSLFLTDEGLLIGYVETLDFNMAVAGMQNEEVNARWQKEMKDFFVQLDKGAADKSMQPIEQVFYLP